MELEGFECLVESNGNRAFERITKAPPDIAILDIGLPGISGIELCKYLREQAGTRDLPVIMLTARDAVWDKIRGLNIGADDYITKPCSVKEVLARINALLRRTKPTITDTLDIGTLSINFAIQRIFCNGDEISLTPTEFKILKALIKAKGRILSRADLCEIVWGFEYSGDERKVDVNIKRLRDKLNDCNQYIKTAKGIGYRIQMEQLK